MTVFLLFTQTQKVIFNVVMVPDPTDQCRHGGGGFPYKCDVAEVAVEVLVNTVWL